eukprot:3343754-Rhodomonas_salina.5
MEQGSEAGQQWRGVLGVRQWRAVGCGGGERGAIGGGDRAAGRGAHREGGASFAVSYTPNSNAKKNAFSGQFVPGMRFLVFDFALYAGSVIRTVWYGHTFVLGHVRYVHTQCAVLAYCKALRFHTRCPVMTCAVCSTGTQTPCVMHGAQHWGDIKEEEEVDEDEDEEEEEGA